MSAAWWRDPLWRRALLAQTVQPVAAAAVAAAVAVLVAVTVSAHLFLTSVSAAALASRTADAPLTALGLRARTEGPIDGPSLGAIATALGEQVASVPGLGPPGLTLVSAYQETSGTGLRLGSGGREETVVLLARHDVAANLERVEGGDPRAPGLWVPDVSAERLGLRPGDTVRVRRRERSVWTTVAGTYRDPSDAPDGYWRALAPALPRSRGRGALSLPPVAVADEATFAGLAVWLREEPALSWEAVPETRPTLAQADALLRGYEAVRRAALDFDSPLRAALQLPTGGARRLEFASALPEFVEAARATSNAALPPLQALSLAGQAAALGVVAGAAVFATRRRAGELRLLAAEGVSPGTVGLRAPLESLPALLLGAVAGVGAGALLAAGLGPSRALDGASLVRAAQAGAAWLAAAAGLLAVATTLTAAALMRVTPRREQGPARPARDPRLLGWELPVGVLAAAAWYEVGRGEGLRAGGGLSGIGDAADLDLLAIAFPLLLLLVACGLGVRLLARVLARRRPAAALPVSLLLALRRLSRSAAPGGGFVLPVTALATAVGLLVHAWAVVGATAAAVDDKTAVLVGADLVVELPGEPGDDEGPAGTTVVRRGLAELQPDGRDVELLVVDPATFAGAAAWRPSFDPRPLAALLGALPGTPEEPVPALVVGSAQLARSPDAMLDLTGEPVAIDAVATLGAFPGLRQTRPTVVVAAPAWFAATGIDLAADPGDRPQTRLRSELWADLGAASEVEVEAFGLAQGAQLRPASVSRMADARRLPRFQAQVWSLSYLRALGTLAAAVALVGLLLLVLQRERARLVAAALTRRMGLSAGASRAALLAEVGGLLAAALLVGCAAGLAVARLTMPLLDPLPAVPPPAAATVPVAALVAAVAGAGAVALVTVELLQRRADAADLARVFRVG